MPKFVLFFKCKIGKYENMKHVLFSMSLKYLKLVHNLKYTLGDCASSLSTPSSLSVNKYIISNKVLCIGFYCFRENYLLLKTCERLLYYSWLTKSSRLSAIGKRWFFTSRSDSQGWWNGGSYLHMKLLCQSPSLTRWLVRAGLLDPQPVTKDRWPSD